MRAKGAAPSAAEGQQFRAQRRSGFTMLEAVVALAIVALVCVGVLGAHGAALRADVTAAERLPLSVLATERLAVVDLDPGTLEHLPDSLARGEFRAPYAGATWSISTARVPQATDLFDVVVRVRDRDDVFTLRTRRHRPSTTLAGR